MSRFGIAVVCTMLLHPDRPYRFRLRISAIIGVFVALFARAAVKGPEPIASFDLNRYLGTWYEIARMPSRFERGLDSVTATYSLRTDGSVKVVNQGSRNGKRSRAVGRAKFTGRSDVGALRVTFFAPFYADYTILDLDTAQYRWAMVASGRKYLWILSRTPALDFEIVDSLVNRAAGLGFETDRLYFTRQ
jgi:apolipoprotein D and lipocalin family protein